MFIIENYGFFIFLIVIILIIFYFQNGECFDLRKNIREGFKSIKEGFVNPSKINMADKYYLGSFNRRKDYLMLQKARKRYELPFNCHNEGYISDQLHTPLVPLNSHPTLNFHHPYGPEKDLCC
tara:strand:- start:1721 stop:2089 length:369 start_codon:yes stop_codon:yes gene_type:complete